jgi:ADP-heptose:LPS heptosyltransferase
VRFFSLQKNAGTLPPDLPLTDLAPAIDDFADSAALIARLDLLISIDSAPAHLAGALGVPCWLLLPARKADWRWLHGRDDSPWYPDMRLFRQTQRGDWSGPVSRMACALRKYE